MSIPPAAKVDGPRSPLDLRKPLQPKPTVLR